MTVHIQPAPVVCRPPTGRVYFWLSGTVVRKVLIISDVDLEMFISLVQEHPVLWDKTVEE